MAKRLGQVSVGVSVDRLRAASSTRITVPAPPFVRAQLGAGITVESADLPPALLATLKHAASMPNPLFYERQRRRASTWDIPRFLRSYDETLTGDLILPRGLLTQLGKLMEQAGSKLQATDERQPGTAQDFSFSGALDPEQQAAHADTPAPWDIGRPQPAFARLADEGRLTGRLLDAGCGTGENALLAASRGADVTGIDVAPAAIARARAKASERGLTARFEVADALDLGRLRFTADTVIDSGMFHVFGDDDRARYVDNLAAVLRPAGICYLMCFSDRQPGTWGPRRVRAEELRAAFSDGWAVESITAGTFDIHPMDGTTQVQAWLAAIRRN